MNNIKGPWSVADKIWIEDSEGYLVASVSIKYGDKANLIAAAPELLEALNQTVQCLEDVATLKGGWAWEEVVTEARAAIAKAKGDV